MVGPVQPVPGGPARGAARRGGSSDGGRRSWQEGPGVVNGEVEQLHEERFAW
jgi:hypothetical protein